MNQLFPVWALVQLSSLVDLSTEVLLLPKQELVSVEVSGSFGPET